MKKVALLFGGSSTEHEISLKTGSFIFHTLDRSKYTVKAIPITKTGDWYIPKAYESHFPDLSLFPFPASDEFFKSFEKENNLISQKGISIHTLDAEVVVLGLHGGQGEDGTIQGLLASHNLPFTGSGVLASALAMDKEKANRIFAQAGFFVAPFLSITQEEFRQNKEKCLQDAMLLGDVLFVKPALGGSSVGVGMAHNVFELTKRLDELFLSEPKVLIQKNIVGVELSCGVLEKREGLFRKSFSLTPTEIVPETQFFDFEAKYLGKSREITPARVSAEVTKEVQRFALLAHNVLGCRGYSRTDFIIQDEKPYVLETNTLPGMTATSLIPQQAKYAGIEMKQVLDWLIELAI
jgi:D-alanine-D-alanine ligase